MPSPLFFLFPPTTDKTHLQAYGKAQIVNHIEESRQASLEPSEQFSHGKLEPIRKLQTELHNNISKTC